MKEEEGMKTYTNVTIPVRHFIYIEIYKGRHGIN